MSATRSGASLVLTLRHEDPVTPWQPLRLLDAPGPALLRQNLSWVGSETNPPPASRRRIVHGAPEHVWCLFDVDVLAPALAACAELARDGLVLTAVRGRALPDGAREHFELISFEPGLLPLLAATGGELPARWTHPVILAQAFDPRYAYLRYGVVFSRLPEPGVLGLVDVGRAGVREGACTAALDQALEVEELPVLLAAFARAGAAPVLLVDNGGDVGALADALAATGRLGAFFGVARRPPPPAVAAAGVPIYVWLEPEDADAPAVPGDRGCAFVPVGLPGEDAAAATARLLALRARGYATVIPRFFSPVPNTHEWQRLEARHPLRPGALARLDGTRLLFSLPGWEPAEGPELLALWTEGNRPATAPRSGEAAPPPTYTLRAVGTVLDGYVRTLPGAGTEHHACEAVQALRDALPAAPPALAPLDEYPFAAWRGRSLLALVEEAVERRLRALDGVPEPLLRAVQHAVLSGGKRIRPVLALVITCAYDVPLDAALPAALAVEWVHCASLVQDDLPCMDDDLVRRHGAATHLRHGEGLALLAADVLVAIAVEDLAALGAHPRVGPTRALALLAHLARAIGPHGLAGGQARDLLAREAAAGIADVVAVHRGKTAPLFALAAALATTLADVEPPATARLTALLAETGVAFQIVDDALDETPHDTAFGRPAGSDRRRRLPTFARLLGPAAARRHARDLVAPHLVLEGLGVGLAPLARLARFAVTRRH